MKGKYIEFKIPPFNEMEKIIFNKDDISNIPKVAGIYFLFDKELKYVGMTNNLYKRICWHKIYSNKIFSEICYIEVPNKFERKLIEKYCIETFKPILNGINTDKSTDSFWYETKDMLVCPSRNVCMSKPKEGDVFNNVRIIRKNGEIFGEGIWGSR